MDPLYLEEDDFNKSFELTPRVACNLFVVDREDRFILTRRALDPERGKWNIPGSFLLKHETIDQCLVRTAAQKLGFPISARDCRLKIVHENLSTDPRGHVVTLIYKYRLLKDILMTPWGDSSEMAPFTHIPDEMAFDHAEILKKLV
ncbi:MAG: NUDIX domain-containing protein [Candidatus Roizmanbacteria bacterium]